MRLRSFLRDKLFFLLIQALLIAFLAVFLQATGAGGYTILFLSLLFVLGDAAVLLWEYFKKIPYYRQVRSCFDRLDRKYLLSEMLERPGFAEGAFLYELLQGTAKSMNDRIASYKRSAEEYREYVETWVHEIKTPIASSRLIIENHRGPVTEDIEEELSRVESLVEQALFYARSNSVEKDYSIREIRLRELVSAAVKKHSRALIESKIALELGALDYTVYTDTKWLDFILGQMITNAIKYHKEEARLRIGAEEKANLVELMLWDNGIGIAQKDIPRVFDKGFTGENGRRFGKSTGIGLYLCKKLCAKLGLQISLASRQGEWTCVTIRFPKGKHFLLEEDNR